MAIKKYRVAHGIESVILGVLICAGLAFIYARTNGSNTTQNKEIVHLNKLYQEKLELEQNKTVAKKLKGIQAHQDDLDEILNQASRLNDQISQLRLKCVDDNNNDCIKKTDEMITLLGLQ